MAYNRNLSDFAYMNEEVDDWEYASLADAGGSALLSGIAAHFGFRSNVLGRSFNALFITIGAGIGASLQQGPKAKLVQDMADKSKAISTAEYIKLDMYRAASIADFVGATGHLLSSGAQEPPYLRLYTGNKMLCSSADSVAGLKPGGILPSSATAGFLLGVGSQFAELARRAKSMQESIRRPTAAQLVRSGWR